MSAKTKPAFPFNLWLTLMVIWLLLNASLSADVVVTGLVVSAAIALALNAFSTAYAEIHLTPTVLWNVLLFLGVFAVELVKANLHVARLVFSPKLEIQPGIVEIRTQLKSASARLMLANAITLTPGTLVVDIDGDSLFVHWISVTAKDPLHATQAIAARFEHHLGRIYG